MWDEDIYRLATSGYMNMKTVKDWSISLAKANEMFIENQLTLEEVHRKHL
jgi:hypothetical protein